MDGASALARSTVPTPNTLRLVELIDPHNLAAHRTVAAAASWHNFGRVLVIAHGAGTSHNFTAGVGTPTLTFARKPGR